MNLKEGKNRWLVLLAVGLIFLILAFPTGGRGSRGEPSKPGLSSAGRSDDLTGESAPEGRAASPDTGRSVTMSQDGSDAVQAGSLAAATYEQQLELRLKELLSHVEGVGEVEVMIVLKSSEEKVWRTDRNSSMSSTQETDSNGGTRDVRSQEISEDTILAGTGEGQGPLLEKELKPQIGGVVVSAQGGGSPSVQAEISAAVEALFDVPSHKIKVLKRAE